MSAVLRTSLSGSDSAPYTPSLSSLLDQVTVKVQQVDPEGGSDREEWTGSILIRGGACGRGLGAEPTCCSLSHRLWLWRVLSTWSSSGAAFRCRQTQKQQEPLWVCWTSELVFYVEKTVKGRWRWICEIFFTSLLFHPLTAESSHVECVALLAPSCGSHR